MEQKKKTYGQKASPAVEAPAEDACRLYPEPRQELPGHSFPRTRRKCSILNNLHCGLSCQ